MHNYTLSTIADWVNGHLHGDPLAIVTSIAPVHSATHKQITFINHAKFAHKLAESTASCVLVSEQLAEHCPSNYIVVDNPYLAYAIVSQYFVPAKPTAGIHPTAAIGSQTSISPTSHIGANVSIGDRVTIEDNVIIDAGSVVGNDCHIGRQSHLYANVSCYHNTIIGADCIIHSGTVLGSDGFGFVPTPSNWQKIHQLGGVVLGDRVEIGGNCSIDRGALGDTILADDVKLDNLVHIAHNVCVGAHTAIAGMVGIAGSTTVGKHCQIAGQAGLGGHITIADNVIIMAKALILKSITEPGSYSSAIPAAPVAQWNRNAVRFTQLNELAKKINRITK